MNLLKSIQYTTTITLNTYYGLGVSIIMMCPHRIIICNQRSTLMKWWQQGNNLLKHLLKEEVPAHWNVTYCALEHVPAKQESERYCICKEETYAKITAPHSRLEINPFSFISLRTARVKPSGCTRQRLQCLIYDSNTCLNKKGSPEPLSQP